MVGVLILWAKSMLIETYFLYETFTLQSDCMHFEVTLHMGNQFYQKVFLS